MKENLFLLIVIFSVSTVFSQQKQKDSLYKVLRKYETQGVYSQQNYIDNMVKLARLYRFRKPDSLKFFATKALEKSDSLKYEKGRALSILHLGDYYSDIDKPNLANEKYEQANSIAVHNKEFEVQVEVLKSQAMQKVFDGQPREAVTKYYEAITVAKAQTLLEPEARLRHNLGFFYWSNELYDEAEKEYLIADSLWSVINNRDMQASTISNIALNAIDKKDYVQAKRYADLSITALKDKGQPLWLSRAYRVKGRWYFSQGLYNDALRDIKKSEELLLKVNNPRDQLEINVLYGKIYIHLKDYKSSHSKALIALQTAEELNDANYRMDCYQILENIARNKGNIEEAFRYLELNKKLKDSINLKSPGNNLKLVRAKLDFEQEQSEQIQKNRKDLQRQKILLWSTIGLVIIIAYITFLIVRNSRTQKKLNTELKRLNNSKNKVFSTIGNDLKKPIGTLQELLNLYRNKDITAEELRNITPRLKENVDHSAFSLNNLLFWAQIQMQSIEVTPKLVNLKQSIDEICSLYEEQIEKKNLIVQCNIRENIIVFVDNDHFDIVLKNIISNTIKFSGKRRKITFDILQSLKTTQLLICDEGMGMDKELVAIIFAKKHIVSQNGTLNEKGTGLGLIICQELLELNKGKLKIESEPNKGTCFYITLPNHKQIIKK